VKTMLAIMLGCLLAVGAMQAAESGKAGKKQAAEKKQGSGEGEQEGGAEGQEEGQEQPPDEAPPPGEEPNEGEKKPAKDAKKLSFKKPEAAKTFEDAKAAFMAKKYQQARELLVKVKPEAADKTTQEEVKLWIDGLKGLQDYLIIEGKAKTQGGWAYENAQVKFLVNIQNPSGKLFRKLIDDLQKPERKLVYQVESFEHGGPYDEKYGKTFVHRPERPQYVIEGERSLKWECKNRDCRVLKITNVPKDWSPYEYVGLWMFQEPGKNSDLQVWVRNLGGPAEKKSDKADKRPKGAAKRPPDVTVQVDGFQGKIEPHVGWKYVTLYLTGSRTDLQRIGKGDLTNVAFLHFQLPTVKRFVVYLDDIVLVRKN
jgi:hypothetical protein